MKKQKGVFTKVGMCAVDAGLVMIGDPCYSHCNSVWPYKDWQAFCADIEKLDAAKQIKFKAGHSGFGVVIGNFGGDGSYPVFVEKDKDGRVVGAMIRFDQ
jgi:hypothetical protein